jgi:hypothetical protein
MLSGGQLLNLGPYVPISRFGKYNAFRLKVRFLLASNYM